MSFEFPTDPRKALEASLTALLLGELPDAQARFLRQAIATDPEVAKTFETLKKTIDLIRETEASPVPEPVAKPAAPKLSDQRRQELLQRFKTVQPAQFKEHARSRFAWVVPVAAAAALVMVLATLLLPVLSKSKSNSSRNIAFNESENRELLQRRNAVVAPSLSSDEPPRKLTEHHVDQNEGLARRDSGLSPLSSSATPSGAPPAVALQNRIILPAEPKSELLTLDPSGTVEEKRDDGFESRFGRDTFNKLTAVQSPASREGDLSLANSSSTTQDGAGLGGGGVANAQPTIPILGDVPVIGRLYQSEFAPTNGPAFAWDGKAGLRGYYDDLDAFVPQAQAGQNGVTVPLVSQLHTPYFGLGAPKEQTAEAKDQSQYTASLDDTQQTWAYYAGGSFGGFSTVQPWIPQPGQKVDSISIAGVGNVPVLRQLTQDAEKGALEKAPVIALSSVQLDSSSAPEIEAGRKPTLAEVGVAKESSNPENEKLKESLVAVNDKEQNLKKDVKERSKNLAFAIGGSARTEQDDMGAAKAAPTAPQPQPEIQTLANPFSTFSLNVSDVSFKLAAVSLEKGVLPDQAGIRGEEFINAFDYRDPEPAAGQPVAFAWERAISPFAQNRDLLRFSIKTAAAGRQTGRSLNLVLLLDNSGSMERADRVRIIHEALRVLAAQLGAQDTFSVVTFARTPSLWADGIPGDQAGRVADELGNLTPQGGTNLEEAMKLAYQTALRHYTPNGINRVVLLTDGAANLGDTDPEVLKRNAETNRKQGIALDCFGIGWEGYNDDLLEVLTRNGGGRYGFLNTPEEAAAGFANQLAGALHVAASDVKVQVEFNTNRVISYRQIGYARHQLAKEQFRDNSVNAAAIGAAESGNAVYVIESTPQGEGPLAIVRVRYRIPGTVEYHEHEWTVPFTGIAAPLDQASPAMRLSATAGAFSEWLASSPDAADVTPDHLLGYLSGVSSVYGADPRPQKLEWMIRQAKAISGK